MDSQNRETDRRCPACGEPNPPQFELCWNCGGELRDAPQIDPSESSAKNDEGENEPEIVTSEGIRWSDWIELTGVLLANCGYRIIWYAVSGPDTRPPASVATTLMSIPTYIGWLMVLWLLVRRDRRMRQPKPLNSGHWYSELFFALAILVAAWALSIVTAVLAVDFGLPRVVPRAHVEITNFDLAAAYGITWCFAVAFEEVLFRVYLQSKLESLLGETILPILISAAVFAAGHGYPPRGTLQVFTFGVLFGVVYRMTFRLPRLVLAHWLWDFLTAVLR